jgi:aminomethyltransferase
VDLAMIATQGPRAREKAARALTPQERMKALAVGNFQATFCGDLFVAGTGYTGEDGWEIMVPAERAVGLWNALLEAGIAPIGLGARDTLRVESGMKLYGADMDESSHPLESGLGWTIAWEPRDRDFIGRAALETIRLAGSRFELVGLVLEARGVLRAHQHVVVRGVDSVGARVTSGTFAPTLGRSIGLARVPVGVRGEVAVEIRGKLLPARIVSPPFVRRGQILV